MGQVAMTMKIAIAVMIDAFYPGMGLEQTTHTDTNCRANENSMRCTSRSTVEPPPSGGALTGVTKALANSRNNRTDWTALQKLKDQKNERRFEEDANGIDQIRLNYATHQQSGDIL